MPSFRDENDFRDRVELANRSSFSNDQLFGAMPPELRAANKLVVYGSGADPARGFDRRGQIMADTVQAPFPKDDDPEGNFVRIQRTDDGRRRLDRSSNRWPSTLWGTPARVETNNAWVPVFRNPTEVIPCVERKVRREVLFAKRLHGGRHRRKRTNRRNYWSTIGC